ncbi:LPS export ABC transporter periplasmic protein LptC [Jannaschia marina]|uniref:LPS export ABC transporter periplasmic protein LptC n=1 Tax=Jannaschia marina TaxID=2741674 RepID=UPI0015CA53DF|nr:LPS export ABC transporter periplasmic protein LptC [Jannaschia marina]
MLDRSPSNPLYSRLVRLAALVLPVLALLLLSSMFLLARRVNPEDAIPLATVDVSERANDQQLTMPRFTGVSQGRTAFDLSARAARPDSANPRLMSAETLRLVLEDTDGGRATVVSRRGNVDTGTRTIELLGDVRIDTSTGYALRTEALSGTLGTLAVEAPGEVRGEGPLGTLRAGGMSLTEDPETGAGRLVFTNGVDLLYTPPS